VELGVKGFTPTLSLPHVETGSDSDVDPPVVWPRAGPPDIVGFIGVKLVQAEMRRMGFSYTAVDPRAFEHEYT